MLRFTIIILLIAAIAGCANPQAPSGGPRDTRPPQILSQSLDDRTINFDDNRITLEFDKYMDKVKMQESIFISPDADFQVRWRGKKMQINLTSELEENTTYILNLGTEYTDILGNKPAEAFSIVFSTGSIIDSGTVTGRIYAKDPTKISVMAYRLDNILVDTLDIRNVKPNYRTSVGTNSLFNIQGLPDGKFRIIAINDVNRDGLYSEGTDEFGAFTQDVEVIDAVAENVKIYVGGIIDVIPPQLSGTRSINNSEFTANFTKSLDSNSLSINSFTLNKENSTDTLEIVSVSFVDKSANQLSIVLREPISDIESKLMIL